MTPTLHPGDILWAKNPHDLKRGHIVVFMKTALLLKRVIGLPGERLQIRSGRVLINETPLSEPYVPETAYLEPQTDGHWNLEPDAYFVLGDARDDSLDSRKLGPINRDEIKGIATFRFWPWRAYGTLMALLLCLHQIGSAQSNRTEPHLITFASENHLAVMVGMFEPGPKWVQSTDFYTPPQSRDTFTLYGSTGEVAEVTITESRLPRVNGVFADWDAKVTPWDNASTPYALAISGRSPVPSVPLQSIPLDDSESRKIMGNYLKSRGLTVQEPLLTQAFQMPIDDQGNKVTLLVAHSDVGSYADDRAADVYAVALLCWNDQGREKVLPLASQASHKPAGRTIAEHEKYYGKRDFLRILAAVDLVGDGTKEIALYRARDSATQIDIFRFDGRRLRLVLSAYKLGYN
jgi:signal peptidase I